MFEVRNLAKNSVPIRYNDLPEWLFVFFLDNAETIRPKPMLIALEACNGLALRDG